MWRLQAGPNACGDAASMPAAQANVANNTPCLKLPCACQGRYLVQPMGAAAALSSS